MIVLSSFLLLLLISDRNSTRSWLYPKCIQRRWVTRDPHAYLQSRAIVSGMEPRHRFGIATRRHFRHGTLGCTFCRVFLYRHAIVSHLAILWIGFAGSCFQLLHKYQSENITIIQTWIDPAVPLITGKKTITHLHPEGRGLLQKGVLHEYCVSLDSDGEMLLFTKASIWQGAVVQVLLRYASEDCCK